VGYAGEAVACGGGGPARADNTISKEKVQRKKLILKFQIDLDFGKTLRNFTRRFRGNLDMGILPKFF
jgi:hypothetical protein